MILVSHGDVITAMLEGVVERKVSDERYYVFHPDPASLCIVETKDRPFLILYNYHRRQFAKFDPGRESERRMLDVATY